jgi:hypothetical protein
VLRVILLDGLPLAQPKYKRPVNFLLSALRMLNVETDGVRLHDYLAPHGAALFQLAHARWLPRLQRAWQGNLMPRWQFAFALIRNELKDTKHNLNLYWMSLLLAFYKTM